MILLLDAGNSRFKWAKLSRSRPILLGNKSYGTQSSADSVIKVLDNLHPHRVVIASVLDTEFSGSLRLWAESKTNIELQFITTQTMAYGVRIAYAHPEHLGVDRFVALVAAHRHTNTASVIIDCGTAVTIDALSAGGEHLGGLIMPGLEMMRVSLVKDTNRIRFQDDSVSLPLLARDTGEAVLSGTQRMLASAIDRLSSQMETELTSPVTRILCGGDAPRMISWLEGNYIHDPLLVLKGLAAFALAA